MFTAFFRRNQAASIKYNCYVFNCLMVALQIVFVGFTYSSSILPTVRGSLCNDDSLWKTMGILKDIRHIHSESPSWSYRAFFNSDLLASFIGFMGFLLVKQGTWPFAKLIFKSIVDFFSRWIKTINLWKNNRGSTSTCLQYWRRNWSSW